MVISLGAGTHVFQLDRALGEFVLTKHNIKMPSRGRHHSRDSVLRCFGEIAMSSLVSLLRSRITAHVEAILGSKFDGPAVGKQSWRIFALPFLPLRSPAKVMLRQLASFDLAPPAPPPTLLPYYYNLFLPALKEEATR